jgi:hypothetical protein
LLPLRIDCETTFPVCGSGDWLWPMNLSKTDVRKEVMREIAIEHGRSIRTEPSP